MGEAEVHRASRVVPASAEAVYRAMVEADELVRWLPPEGMSASIERFDARPGGGCVMTLRYPAEQRGAGKTTADTDVIESRFTRLEPGRLVEQQVDFASDDPAFAGTMTMRWELLGIAGESAEGGADRCEVTIVATDVPAGIDRAAHEQAFASTLENLERFLRDAR